MQGEIQIINRIVDIILGNAKEIRIKEELATQCIILVRGADGSHNFAYLANAYTFFKSSVGIKYQFPAFIRESCRLFRREKKCEPVAIITLSDVWIMRYKGPSTGEWSFLPVMPADSPIK